MKRFAIIMLALCLGLVAACSRDDSETKKAVTKVMRENPQIVLDVLKDNSELLYELVQKGEQIKRIKDLHSQMEAGLKTPLKPVLEGSALTTGPEDAVVTLVEYSNFGCYYCAQASATIQQLLEKHPDKFRVVFKHFVSTNNTSAYMAARYVEAAGLQDQTRAWQLLGAIFADQEQLLGQGETWVIKLANDLGLNLNKLVKDAASPELIDKIKADTEEARSFGFTGTPTFVVNGVAMQGVTVEVFEDFLTVAEQFKLKHDQEAQVQAEKELAAKEAAAKSAGANTTDGNATESNATDSNATESNVTAPDQANATETPANATDDQPAANITTAGPTTPINGAPAVPTNAGPAAPASASQSTPVTSDEAPATNATDDNATAPAGTDLIIKGETESGDKISIEVTPSDSSSAADSPTIGHSVSEGMATSTTPVPGQQGRLNATGPEAGQPDQSRVHEQPFGRPVQPPVLQHDPDNTSRTL